MVLLNENNPSVAHTTHLCMLGECGHSALGVYNMRKLLIALASIVALPAYAADLPVKALIRQPILFTYVGSGFYMGLGTWGEVDKAKIVSPLNLQAVNGYAAGGSINGTAGYMWGNGTTWTAIEASISYQNIGITDNNGSSVGSRFGFTERALFGGPITSVLSLLPNLSTVFPVLPTPIASTTTHPYVFAAVHQDDVSAEFGLTNAKVWRVRGGLGVGLKQQLGSTSPNPAASGVTADIWAEYLMDGASIVIGAPVGVAKANQGSGARVGMTLEY